MSRKRNVRKLTPGEGAQQAWDSHQWTVTEVYEDECTVSAYRCKRCGQVERYYKPTVVASCRPDKRLGWPT